MCKKNVSWQSTFFVHTLHSNRHSYTQPLTMELDLPWTYLSWRRMIQCAHFQFWLNSFMSLYATRLFMLCSLVEEEELIIARVVLGYVCFGEAVLAKHRHVPPCKMGVGFARRCFVWAKYICQSLYQHTPVCPCIERVLIDHISWLHSKTLQMLVATQVAQISRCCFVFSYLAACEKKERLQRYERLQMLRISYSN